MADRKKKATRIISNLSKERKKDADTKQDQQCMTRTQKNQAINRTEKPTDHTTKKGVASVKKKLTNKNKLGSRKLVTRNRSPSLSATVTQTNSPECVEYRNNEKSSLQGSCLLRNKQGKMSTTLLTQGYHHNTQGHAFNEGNISCLGNKMPVHTSRSVNKQNLKSSLIISNKFGTKKSSLIKGSGDNDINNQDSATNLQSMDKKVIKHVRFKSPEVDSLKVCSVPLQRYGSEDSGSLSDENPNFLPALRTVFKASPLHEGVYGIVGEIRHADIDYHSNGSSNVIKSESVPREISTQTAQSSGCDSLYNMFENNLNSLENQRQLLIQQQQQTRSQQLPQGIATQTSDNRLQDTISETNGEELLLPKKPPQQRLPLPTYTHTERLELPHSTLPIMGMAPLQTIKKPSVRKRYKNKGVLFKPDTITKGTMCRPMARSKATMTDPLNGAEDMIAFNILCAKYKEIILKYLSTLPEDPWQSELLLLAGSAARQYGPTDTRDQDTESVSSIYSKTYNPGALYHTPSMPILSPVNIQRALEVPLQHTKPYYSSDVLLSPCREDTESVCPSSINSDQVSGTTVLSNKELESLVLATKGVRSDFSNFEGMHFAYGQNPVCVGMATDLEETHLVPSYFTQGDVNNSNNLSCHNNMNTDISASYDEKDAANEKFKISDQIGDNNDESAILREDGINQQQKQTSVGDQSSMVDQPSAGGNVLYGVQSPSVTSSSGLEMQTASMTDSSKNHQWQRVIDVVIPVANNTSPSATVISMPTVDELFAKACPPAHEQSDKTSQKGIESARKKDFQISPEMHGDNTKSASTVSNKYRSDLEQGISDNNVKPCDIHQRNSDIQSSIKDQQVKVVVQQMDNSCYQRTGKIQNIAKDLFQTSDTETNKEDTWSGINQNVEISGDLRHVQDLESTDQTSENHEFVQGKHITNESEQFSGTNNENMLQNNTSQFLVENQNNEDNLNDNNEQLGHSGEQTADESSSDIIIVQIEGEITDFEEVISNISLNQPHSKIIIQQTDPEGNTVEYLYSVETASSNPTETEDNVFVDGNCENVNLAHVFVDGNSENVNGNLQCNNTQGSIAVNIDSALSHEISVNTELSPRNSVSKSNETSQVNSPVSVNSDALHIDESVSSPMDNRASSLQGGTMLGSGQNSPDKTSKNNSPVKHSSNSSPSNNNNSKSEVFKYPELSENNNSVPYQSNANINAASVKDNNKQMTIITKEKSKIESESKTLDIDILNESETTLLASPTKSETSLLANPESVECIYNTDDEKTSKSVGDNREDEDLEAFESVVEEDSRDVYSTVDTVDDYMDSEEENEDHLIYEPHPGMHAVEEIASPASPAASIASNKSFKSLSKKEALISGDKLKTVFQTQYHSDSVSNKNANIWETSVVENEYEKCETYVKNVNLKSDMPDESMSKKCETFSKEATETCDNHDNCETDNVKQPIELCEAYRPFSSLFTPISSDLHEESMSDSISCSSSVKSFCGSDISGSSNKYCSKKITKGLASLSEKMKFIPSGKSPTYVKRMNEDIYIKSDSKKLKTGNDNQEQHKSRVPKVMVLKMEKDSETKTVLSKREHRKRSRDKSPEGVSDIKRKCLSHHNSAKMESENAVLQGKYFEKNTKNSSISKDISDAHNQKSCRTYNESSLRTQSSISKEEKSYVVPVHSENVKNRDSNSKTNETSQQCDQQSVINKTGVTKRKSPNSAEEMETFHLQMQNDILNDNGVSQGQIETVIPHKATVQQSPIHCSSTHSHVNSLTNLGGASTESSGHNKLHSNQNTSYQSTQDLFINQTNVSQSSSTFQTSQKSMPCLSLQATNTEGSIPKQLQFQDTSQPSTSSAMQFDGSATPSSSYMINNIGLLQHQGQTSPVLKIKDPLISGQDCNDFGEDVLELALKMAVEIPEEPMTDFNEYFRNVPLSPVNYETVDTAGLLMSPRSQALYAPTFSTEDSLSLDSFDSDPDYSPYADQPVTTEVLPRGRGRPRGRSSRSRPSSYHGGQGGRRGRGRQAAAGYSASECGGGRRSSSWDSNTEEPPTTQDSPSQAISLPEQPTRVKKVLDCSFLLSAWKFWIHLKNIQIQRQNMSAGGTSDKRSPVQLKYEILALLPWELNQYLAFFVKEVRKPNGEHYQPDSIYYFCLSIQKYLLQSKRTDNLFCDFIYERFQNSLNDVLTNYTIKLDLNGHLLCRVEEDYLWQSRQLGAYSPYTLLHTLLYMNTKYGNLKTIEQHQQLTFSKAKSIAKRYVLEKKYENPCNLTQFSTTQQRELYNPRRCPNRLYNFYVSKCLKGVEKKSEWLYLNPEKTCVHQSPVWYTWDRLSLHAMQRMLNRIFVVKDIQEALLLKHTSG